MGIRVKCPHGHIFKVKDKYAGKRGLCPHCADQVVVEVPSLDASDNMQKAYRQAVVEEQRHAQEAQQTAHQAESGGDDSIFDDAPQPMDSSTSGSLLGSSVIRHNVKCEFCKESVPMWYAKCPKCGHFMDQR